MHIFLHKSFIKRYAKLKETEKTKFKERRELFLNDLYDPILNNHALTGKYAGCRSFNVTGDLRVVYDIISKDTVLFVTIDTHSNLYR